MRRDPVLVFLSPLLLIALGGGALLTLTLRARAPHQVPGEALYREIMDKVRTRYVTEPGEEALVYGAARGLVGSLDPHSRVFDATEWAEHQRENQGNQVGIGVRIDRLDGHLSVLEVIPKSPAHRAGLRPGDWLLRVGDLAVTENIERDLVSDHMQGEPGSTLPLSVQNRDGSPTREVLVTRGLFEQQTAYGAMVDPNEGVGYIHVTSFRENTLRLFHQHMERLREAGLKRLIVDLRWNRGGLLDVAIGLANRFVKTGVLVSVVGRDHRRDERAKARAVDGGLPVIVLVDRDSASASEVFAGALQDHSAAVLLGERTYGKGVVQSLMEFETWPGGVKLTTAHHFTPAGRCIEKTVALPGGGSRRGGLQPDVIVPLKNRERSLAFTFVQRLRYQDDIREALRAGDGPNLNVRDPQLEAAVQILTGHHAPDMSTHRTE